MEKSSHQVSSHLPLQQFVASAGGELEKLHYSRRTLERYRAVWRHLIAFCHEMNLEDRYSQELAEQFRIAYQMWFWRTLRMTGALNAPSPTCRRYRSRRP